MLSVLNLKNPASLDKLTNAFPYQIEAIDTVRNLEYAAIFFEQGLGKTKIAIDLILDWLLEDTVDGVIVVTKKGLVKNWLNEFKIHSHIKPRVFTTDRSANHRAFFSPSRVYIANFESVSLEEERMKLFAKRRRLAIILDESQKIKNPESALAKAFFRLSSCFHKRIIMTGTPIANRPYDIWAQIFFLDNGDSLGDNFINFKNKLDLPTRGDSIENEGNNYISELAKIFPSISDFALRQTKEGSGLELPGKVYKMELAEWEPRQKEMYEQVKSELKIQITKDGVPSTDNTEVLLKRLLRLVQIASNPSVVDESYCNTPGKIGKLDELVSKIIEDGEKVIIWTSFVDNCRYLKNHYANLSAVQIHGKMALNDRNRSVNNFITDKNVRVLIATPSSAKEGLTLTVANHVIFYDRSFSLDDYSQAQDRIHRISQTKTCYIYNIVLPDSIDEWVGALINLKSASARFGMGDSKIEEMEDALSVDISEILNIVLGDSNTNVV